ncbi:MAG: hypothetical protein U0793_16000 [Gemmataceae bacterium]
MTQREQKLLYILLSAVGLVVALFLFYSILLRPLLDLGEEQDQVEASIAKKESQIQTMLKERQLIKVAKERSLPLEPHHAAIEYERYLVGVVQDAGLTSVNFTGPTNLDGKAGVAKGKKTATQTILTFQVKANGTLPRVMDLLTRMQNTPVMHRVKKLTLDRADPKDMTGKLAIAMETEALIYQEIQPNHEPKLTPSAKIDPPGTNPARSYADAGKRNFFVGYIPPPPIIARDKTPPPPPDPFDMRKFVWLDHTVPTAEEAFLRNRMIPGPPQRVGPKKGFETFKVWNEDKKRLLVNGKVLRVDQRDMYFRVDEKTYRWHIGHSIFDAIVTAGPLTRAELEKVGLAARTETKEKEASKEAEKKGGG